MKFNEKLMELRKKEGLSQEEMGYKLNVTRQTVSKWELGQTTPELDKLVEISRIFNISVDELINESEVASNPIIEEKQTRKKDSKNNTLIVIIVIALIAIVILGAIKIFSFFSAFSLFNNAVDQVLGVQEQIVGTESKNFFGKFFDIFFKGVNEVNIRQFNGTLEMYTGTNRGVSLKGILDEIITSNKTEDRKITVKYNELETQDTTEIKNLKRQFGDLDNYEVSFEYDKDGYIYEMIIEKYWNDVDEFINRIRRWKIC